MDVNGEEQREMAEERNRMKMKKRTRRLHSVEIR